MIEEGCDDSTPVRGASYEPAVLSGVSAELRLSQKTPSTIRICAAEAGRVAVRQFPPPSTTTTTTTQGHT
jgi:hypothetical protein